MNKKGESHYLGGTFLFEMFRSLSLKEDIRAYLKDATDEIESEIQEKYILDNVRCYFDIYNIDETFTDFKFVFLVSFKEIKIASLTNLSKIIGKRQLSGASKFYS